MRSRVALYVVMTLVVTLAVACTRHRGSHRSDAHDGDASDVDLDGSADSVFDTRPEADLPIDTDPPGDFVSELVGDDRSDSDADTPPAAPPRMDLLVVVENHGRAREHHLRLLDAIPDFVTGLANPLCIGPDGLPAAPQPATADEPCPVGSSRLARPIRDVRIGFLTSSLGGHGSNACLSPQSGVCPFGSEVANTSTNDRGRLIDRVSPCRSGRVPTWNDEGFLAWDPDQTMDPPGLATREALQGALDPLLNGIGELGCEYPSVHEAWYRFLVDPAPPLDIVVDGVGQAQPQGLDTTVLEQRAAFLRPDSVLAILFVADDDDCSVREEGQYFYALQQREPFSGQEFHLPRARAVCATDPADPCCLSCGQSAGQCDPDPTCATMVLSASEDPLALRCHAQKSRFGIDFLYPLDRYVQALTSATVTDREGNPQPNPLFHDAAGDPIDRPVLLAGLVGVPWQDLARDPDDPSSGVMSDMASGGISIYDLVGGQLATYDPPVSPFMIASIDPRSGTDPRTGIAIVEPLGTPNAVNGTEHSVPGRDDLQYACIYPMRVMRNCGFTGSTSDCACADPANDSPLCAVNELDIDRRTKQVAGQGYPGLRHIALLRLLEDRGALGSICAPPDAAGSGDLGYAIGVEALRERMPRLAPVPAP